MSNKQNEETAKAPTQTKEKHKRTALYTENLPTFYVGSGNNAEL